MLRFASGADISAWYFLVNFDQSAGDAAPRPSFIASTLGARFGNHTSYQFCFENCAFGTPRGGRRTVPIRVPSLGSRGVPRRTTRTLIATLQRFFRRAGLSFTLALRGGLLEGRILSCSSRRSLRVSSAIARTRASISACGPVSGFFSATRRTPVRHHGGSGDAPLIMAIAASKGLHFGAGRKSFGCPTGQAGGSTGAWHCLLAVPVAQKFHGELYGHETLSSSGEALWVGESRIDAGQQQHLARLIETLTARSSWFARCFNRRSGVQKILFQNQNSCDLLGCCFRAASKPDLHAVP
jgi:hypothetical protein